MLEMDEARLILGEEIVITDDDLMELLITMESAVLFAIEAVFDPSTWSDSP